jgi:hypothetical protein
MANSLMELSSEKFKYFLYGSLAVIVITPFWIKRIFKIRAELKRKIEIGIDCYNKNKLR